MSIEAESVPAARSGQQPQLSLSTAAARNLATTTKTVPQMQGITSRWLLKMLPWVEVSGGTYRVNRRLSYPIGGGRVAFTTADADVRVVPAGLRELPLLREFGDEEVLGALAGRFEQRQFAAGDVIAETGRPVEQLVLIAHGKVNTTRLGKYGHPDLLDVLADGQYAGEQMLTGEPATWHYTITAATACTVLVLPQQAFGEITGHSESLRTHLSRVLARPARPQNRRGESDIAVASGHSGEPGLPGTFADYETSPREYALSVAQTMLRVHTRVSDLYSKPMDQAGQQLRLTIEALRERQEHEMINNPDFGLLPGAAPAQRIHTRSGPPTPDDMDELLSRRRKTRLYLAHPRAIAAFGRECSKRGVYPDSVDLDGEQVNAWRGVPLLPCIKIPVTDAGTTAILAMRTGEENEGVIGLHRTGLPDEREPGLNVRFCGVDKKGITSYLVSAYYSVAVLVPDALGVLENVELG